MPRPRKPARIYRREGRAGWYAYLDRDHANVSLGTEDEAEAHRRLAQLADDARRTPAASPGDLGLDGLMTTLLERARTANTPKTAYEIGLNVERVIGWLAERGVVTIGTINQTHVEDYKTARRFSVGAARINRELDSWKRLHKVALESQHGDPAALGWFAHLREPRPAPHRRSPSRKDLQAFLRALPNGYRDLFRTVLGSALRDEEMRHLEAEDLRPGTITVTPKPGWSTKGYRYREIPVSAQTVKAARAWLAARDGLNTDKKRVWTIAQVASKAAGIDAISLHDLRHACASHWLHAGFRVAQISAWLGHADLLTTLRYLGIVDGEKVDRGKLPW